MRHMFAYETSGSEAALTAITPIPDPTLAIISNDVRVPAQLPMLGMAHAEINSAAATLRAQLRSPTLLGILPLDIAPIVNGLIPGGLPPLHRLWQNPLPLTGLEPLDALIQNGAAVMNRVVCEFTDGAIKPVNGNFYSVRATGAASLVTATWVNTALTFGTTLPAGHYQIVGMRVFSANGVAARIFPVGAVWRPGCLCVSTEAGVDWPDFRLGNVGVWGEFDNTTPPTVDILGITDTAQVIILDLAKTK